MGGLGESFNFWGKFLGKSGGKSGGCGTRTARCIGVLMVRSESLLRLVHGDVDRVVNLVLQCTVGTMGSRWMERKALHDDE
jgi:hypothetical protein